MLEALTASSSAFVTMTYAPEFLPAGGTLRPKDLQLFIKRVRKRVGVKIRFFGVGEYGEKTFRPHYHVILFGAGLELSEVIGQCWPMGLVHVGEVTFKSLQYVCGYVCKKMTSSEDERLNGRHPEFARMSNRPGIGKKAILAIADSLSSRQGAIQMAAGGIPEVVRLEGRVWPIGRYLRKALAEAVGMDEQEYADLSIQRLTEKMREVLTVALDDPENVSLSLVEIVAKKNKAQVERAERRFRLLNRRGKL